MNGDKRVMEARAKFMWGESAAQVFKFLQEQGMSEKQAFALLAGFKQERTAEIRGSGIRKMVHGTLLICVPFVAYAGFQYLGFISERLLLYCIIVALVGLWRISNGAIQVFLPQTESGDLSHLND